MTEVRAAAHFEATPAEVGKLVGDFIGFVELLIENRVAARVEAEGVGIGMLRTVTVGQDQVVERLESLDEATWQTSYTMPVTGPFPIIGYLSTIRLADAAGGGTDFNWIGTFDPHGADEETAAAAVRAVYDDGVAALRGRLEERRDIGS